MLALTEAGPGRPSVDEAVFPWLKGNGLALAEFAASAAGAALLTADRTSAEPPADDPEAQLPGDARAPRRERFTRQESEVPASR